MGEPSELGAMLRGALPGAANGRVVTLSAGAAAVCVVLACLAADTRNLRTRGARAAAPEGAPVASAPRSAAALVELGLARIAVGEDGALWVRLSPKGKQLG